MTHQDPPVGKPEGVAPQGTFDPSAKPVTAGGRVYASASWLDRVGATVIDGLLYVPFYLVALVLIAVDDTVGGGLAIIIYLAMLVFSFWQLYRQGSTGSTIGKKVLGIAVIKEVDAMPTKFWLAFGRNLAHAVDSAIIYIGWLFPLWDTKRQTIADKICGTVVIKFK